MATLEALPLDIHFHILFFLLRPSTPVPIHAHPFLALSATSPYLRSVTASYTNHALETLAAHAHEHSPRLPAKLPLRTLLTFITKNCAFCHKPTSSHAKLHPSLPCCRPCDNTHYPNKITLTDAMKKYNLTKTALMTSVPYGQYMCFNVLTTVFLGADVEAFAAKTHGPLPIFLARKDARKKKREENKEAKILQRKRELAALCRANGVDGAQFGAISDSDSGDPADIVRRRILLKRIHNEGRLRDRVERLRENGYGPLIATLHPWQQRELGEYPRNPSDPLDDIDQRFPGEEALADLFMQEFGGDPEARMDHRIYRMRRGFEFDDGWSEPDGLKGFRQVNADKGAAPWSMQCYPVCMNLVFVEEEGRGSRWAAKKRREIEKSNQERRQQFEDVKRQYRLMINMGKWVKCAKWR